MIPDEAAVPWSIWGIFWWILEAMHLRKQHGHIHSVCCVDPLEDVSVVSDIACIHFIESGFELTFFVLSVKNTGNPGVSRSCYYLYTKYSYDQVVSKTLCSTLTPGDR